MYCSKCGSVLSSEASFCAACGTPVKPDDPGRQGAAPDIDCVALFVGKNAAYYRARFERFDVGGMDTFAPTWNWAAFLCTFWWLLYRKLYLWAIVWLAVTFIPVFGLVFWIGAGISGNYVYYRHVKSRIRDARSMQPPEQLGPVLARLGGVNEWVVPVAIVVSAGILLLAILIGLGLGLLGTLAPAGRYI